MKTDILIIGAGSAGLTAALYASRAGLSVIVTDSLSPGGQLLFIDEIENYPSLASVSGYTLTEMFESQAEKAGAKIEYWEIKGVRKDKDIFISSSDDGDIESKAIIISTGATHRALSVPGEEEYKGKGVSYCATCDGPFFKDKIVAVVGGGNTALTEALFLSKIAREVHLIHRRDTFRAEKILQERVKEKENIIPHMAENVKRVNGDGKTVESLTFESGETLECAALFIFVGIEPNSYLVKDLVKTESGFIITDENMETSLKGMFAAGDVRKTPLRQVVTAASDGAIAASKACEYIESLN